MISDDLEVIGYAPLNAETPAARLVHPITPAANVYVRTNFDIPQIDGATHVIRVDGAVDRAFEIPFAELRQLPQVTLTSTMECAGNDRLSVRPLPRGEPWQGGAISTARWSGVPLRALLERAHVGADVVEVLVHGADRGERADSHEPITFARSLPIDVALAPETLLALAMNEEPLTPPHGAPVRLLVPGWYGMASVKWVTHISALTSPFAGYFQTRRYVYQRGDLTEPVTRMRVKSIIVAPREHSSHAQGRLQVWGWAWSGEGAIARVEIAVGDGQWKDATVDAASSPYAWVRWQGEVPLDRAGRVVLRSRATDSTGTTQPEAPEWNLLGYGNNAVQPVTIDVLPST